MLTTVFLNFSFSVIPKKLYHIFSDFVVSVTVRQLAMLALYLKCCEALLRLSVKFSIPFHCLCACNAMFLK